MSYRPYFIEVTGDIVAGQGLHYAQGWAGGSISCRGQSRQVEIGDYKPREHSIIGSALFDRRFRAVPYAFYYAGGSVVNIDGADLACSPGFYPSFAYFKEYMTELREGLSTPVDNEIRELYYNGLYIGAFSILELFLCDFLLCGVFSKEEYYARALLEFGIDESADPLEVESQVKDAVYHKVFHRFGEIGEIFQSVFRMDFPNYSELQKLIYRRHNIVHRFALSNLDRMTVCDAMYEDVDHLIRTIVTFVEEMKDLCGLTENERAELEMKELL